jgi:hypothetical protein
MFQDYRPGMEEARPEDVAQSLSFALMFNGRKRTHEADQLMARIVAKHLVEHLRLSGFVVMKKPPGPGHSTSMGATPE